MVDGKGERRTGIVLQIVGAEGVQDGMFLHQGRVGVEVLQVRQPEGLSDVVTDGEKEESAAFLPKSTHCRRVGGQRRKEQVRLAFAVLRVENADGVAPAECVERCLQASGHVCTLGLPFKKGRIGAFLPELGTL